jgi:hypothetical protein
MMICCARSRKLSPLKEGTRMKLLLLAIISLPAFAYGQGTVAAAGEAMSAARQNALVQKYCAVCHDDVHRNGGLSLQHFDASSVDPSLAAMMASKLQTGAIGAAGLPRPDQATEDAFFKALDAESNGADNWTLIRTEDPSTRAPLLTATILRKAPARPPNTLMDHYRLKLTCQAGTLEGEMQLTWAPRNAGESPRPITVAADSAAPVTYVVEGHETMGNGAKKADGTQSTTGPAATALKGMPLPTKTLRISNLFPDETVVFSFDGLAEAARHELSACFGAKPLAR